METANRIAALAAEIDAALPVLDRIDRFYDQFQQQQVAARQSTENAIIVSDVFVLFYTCLETAFLRISQFFENALDKRGKRAGRCYTSHERSRGAEGAFESSYSYTLRCAESFNPSPDDRSHALVSSSSSHSAHAAA